MKLNSALAKSLLMAASVGMVVPVFAQTPSKPAAPAYPSKPAPKPTAPAPKEDEEEAKIEGFSLPRKAGGFMGVTIDGVRLVVKFYDADKKPVAADVARAAARWNQTNKIGEVRSVLNPSADRMALISTPVLQPPHVYNVYLTLIAVDGTGLESYVVNLREVASASANPSAKAE